MKADVITNQLFYLMVREWERAPNQRIVVEGTPNFSAVQIGNSLIFKGVTFKDDLNLSNARFESDLVFRDCQFEGSVHASNMRVGGDLSFQDCIFKDEKSANGILDLNNCHVEGSLEIRGSKRCDVVVSIKDADIRSRLVISESRIGPHKKNEKDGKSTEKYVPAEQDHVSKFLLLTRSEIGGSMLLGGFNKRDDPRSQFRGNPVARKTRVFGSIDARGVRVEGQCEIENMETWGDLDCTGLSTRSAMSINDVSVGMESSQGNLVLMDTECRQLEFFKTRIFGYASFFNATCEGLVRAHPGENETPGLWVAGELSFPAATIRGQLDLKHAHIDGTLLLNSAHIGSFIIGLEGLPNRIGAIRVIDSRFTSYVKFYGMRVGYKDQLTSEAQEYHGVSFENCSFEAGLFFWAPERRNLYTYERTRSAWRHDPDGMAENNCQACRIDSVLRVINCNIKGDLDLTRVQVLPDAEPSSGNVEGSDNAKKDAAVSRINGGVDLRRTIVTGALLFRSPQSVILDLTEEKWYRDKAREWIEKAGASPICEKGDETCFRQLPLADCSFLVMNDFEATNIDLTGLRLVDTGNDDNNGMKRDGGLRSGHIFAERIKVPGELLCYAEIVESQFPWIKSAKQADREAKAAFTSENGNGTGQPRIHQAYPQIPRSLRLTRAEISDVKISVCSFKEESARSRTGVENPRARDCGIVLENARIGHLWVPPLNAEGYNPRGQITQQQFPKPLDLSGLNVQAWSFSLEDGGEEVDDQKQAQKYIFVLANDEHLNRDVYRAVYQQMNNVGRSRGARLVFEAEHRRAFRESWVTAAKTGEGWKDWLTLLWQRAKGVTRQAVRNTRAIWRSISQLQVLFTVISACLLILVAFNFGWLNNLRITVVVAAGILLVPVALAGLRRLLEFLFRNDATMLLPVILGAALLAIGAARPEVTMSYFSSRSFFMAAGVILLCVPLVKTIIPVTRFSLDALYRGMLSYGVYPMPLLVIILSLPVLTFFWVAREPANFEIAEQTRLVVGLGNIDASQPDAETGNGPIKLHEGVEFEVYSHRCEVTAPGDPSDKVSNCNVLGPKAADWDLGEAIWLTVRYHIPIISVLVRADYEPTDDRGAYSLWNRPPNAHPLNVDGDATKRYAEWKTSFFTPEDWFTVMALINWILWPIWLTFALRLAFRDSSR